MFEEVSTELKKLQDNVEFTRRFLSELRKFSKKIDADLATVNKQMELLKSREDSSDIAGKGAKALIDSGEAERILKEEILVAVGKNREYNYSIFLEAILKVAESPGLITTIIVGSGWNKRLHVDIGFLEAAGSLNDWAEGVIKTREELRVGKGPDAEKASKLWRTKYYKGPSYNKTLLMRIKHSGRAAAFWTLLDKGTVPLASDRGGTAYPHYYRPTNFISSTISRIKRFFRDELLKQRDVYKESVVSLEAAALELQTAKVDVVGIIREVSPEIRKNKSVYDHFKRVEKHIDDLKLDRALHDIRAGRDMKTTSEGRVEITASGSKTRIRPSLTSLVRLMEID